MNRKSPYPVALVCLLTCVLAIPFDALALPDTSGQRAGEVSRVIPAVSLVRGAKSMNASAKTPVDWQDVLNTQANARARVALDDGSVLNVGSDSSVKVTKHDAGAQQTDLEVSFGKMRTQAQKISKPDGKFEVHTPAGVAGVVGTDFFVGYENNMMTVIVFEGQVKVCNLAGVCVFVKPGQFSTVRKDDSSGPAAPGQATLSMMTEAVNNTLLEKGPGIEQVHHIGKGTAITLTIIALIPAIVVPVAVTHGSKPSGVGVPPPCNPVTNPQKCG